MKRIIFTIFFPLVAIIGFSQTKSINLYMVNAEKRGDVLYQKKAVDNAIDAYTIALEKTPGEHQDRIKLKLAESYRLLNDPVQAEKWYAEIIANNFSIDPIHKLHFAEVLLQNGKYSEAKLWLGEYQKEAGSEDQRAANKIHTIEQYEDLYRHAGAINVHLQDFNSAEADFSPSYYRDGLVFTSARSRTEIVKQTDALDNTSFLDLYYYDNSMNVKRLSKGINTKFHEGPAVFFDQDTKIIFTRNDYLHKAQRDGKSRINRLRLFYSEKPADNSKWSDPQEITFFNVSDCSIGHPAISQDGTTLYFSSDVAGGYGNTDLYKSEFKDGHWGEPVNLGPGINTAGDELFPFILNDSTIFFASNGHGGLGGMDIFATSLTQDTPSHITNLGYPINSSQDDFGIILSGNGREGYFSSNRDGGVGSDDIYKFKSEMSLPVAYKLSGTVSELLEGAPIEGVKVSLEDQSGNYHREVISNSNGEFYFDVSPDQIYTVTAEKRDEFHTYHTDYNTLKTGGNNWTVDIALERKHPFNLVGAITDADSGDKIKGVELTLVDNLMGEEVLHALTDANGFTYGIPDKRLNERISYQIKLAKEGYLAKTVVFNHKLDRPGDIDINETLDLSLSTVNIGTDIGKLIDLAPIYFDLGKANIRPDAARELDKVVQVLKDNPSLSIELGAHTDARGNDEYNLNLSDRRAKASANYIISKGIGSERIVGKGYGERSILNGCTNNTSCTEEQHQENRRTEFRVVDLVR